MSAPATAEALLAAHWHVATHVRGRGFESWAYACVELPELTLTHGQRGGLVTQALHVAGVVLPLLPTDAAFPRAAQLINEIRAAAAAPSQEAAHG